MKCLWPVMMTYVILWNIETTETYRKKDTISLNDSSANYTRQKYTYTKVNDFRWSLYSNNAVEDKVFPNDWLADNTYSTSTQRSNDLEKGSEKPSTPSFSGRLWLGVSYDQTSLCSSKMFESSSLRSGDVLGKVWLQTRMQEV